MVKLSVMDTGYSFFTAQVQEFARRLEKNLNNLIKRKILSQEEIIKDFKKIALVVLKPSKKEEQYQIEGYLNFIKVT